MVIFFYNIVYAILLPFFNKNQLSLKMYLSDDERTLLSIVMYSSKIVQIQNKNVVLRKSYIDLKNIPMKYLRMTLLSCSIIILPKCLLKYFKLDILNT